MSSVFLFWSQAVHLPLFKNVYSKMCVLNEESVTNLAANTIYLTIQVFGEIHIFIFLCSGTQQAFPSSLIT